MEVPAYIAKQLQRQANHFRERAKKLEDKADELEAAIANFTQKPDDDDVRQETPEDD